MNWDVLREEIAIYHAKKRVVERLVSLAKKHPEWAQQEPELGALLEQCEAINSKEEMRSP